MASARVVRARSRAVIVGAAAIATVLAATTAISGAAAARPLAPAATADVTVGGPPQQPADIAAITAAPADELLHVTVALAPRDEVALADFVAAVSTPSSPRYRQYLPPGAFGAKFGASPETIAEVTATLRSRGLTVGAAASNGLSIPVSGTVAQVSKAFRTSFKQYQLRSGRSGLANVTAPMLPAGIAAHVQGVVGLNQLTHAIATRTAAAATAVAAATSTGGAGQAPPAAGSTGPTPCPAGAGAATASSAYTSDQIAKHYGIDSLYPTTTGAGVTIGLFELEPFDPNDIAAFQACYGTNATVTVRQVSGGAGTGSGSGEAALDIEELIGLAPSATIIVYEAPNDGASVYDEFRQIATDDAAQVVSDSWGLCEAEAGVPELAKIERPLFQQMAAQGQTMLAATGDTGAEGCYAPPDSFDASLSVWEPASQPEVTAVGGTSVASVDAADTAWGDEFGASGGGISALWPMPAYQRARSVVAQSSGAQCGAPKDQLCRQTPDVSASADVAHGSLAYYRGGWHAVGGTSAATPLWAAIVGLIDSTCAAGPVGFINPTLYQIADPQSSAIVDVAAGPTNDFVGVHPGTYPTTPGYDLTTGLGRPDAGPLAAALCPAVGDAGAGTMSVSPAVVAARTVATLTFTYTPPPGHGMVDGELDLTIPGTWTLPSSDPSTAGYTTSSAGSVTVVGTTIVVSGVTAPAGVTVTITYGDTSGGAAGVETPSTPQATVFSARSRAQQTGAAAPLNISPAVRVLAAGQGGANEAMLVRTAGADRVGTAIAASNAGFPTAGSAGAVVLARDDTFPDALAGVPLAAQGHGPLLLTAPTSLLPAVAAEIARVLPLGAKVDLLGGPAALAPNIDIQLQTLGYVPVRLQGATRFDTAVEIAKALGDPTTVFEADGTNFPDALAAGPAAVIAHGAVLLTNGASAAAPTAAYLSAHPNDIRYAIGGPAAAADPNGSQKFAGIDRFATSILVAQSFFIQPSTVGVASGITFPDALSGGPITALAGGPLVLVPASGDLPAQTQAYLSSIANSVLTGWLFGGAAAVSTQVASQVAQSLVLVPPAS